MWPVCYLIPLLDHVKQLLRGNKKNALWLDLVEVLWQSTAMHNLSDISLWLKIAAAASEF